MRLQPLTTTLLAMLLVLALVAHFAFRAGEIHNEQRHALDYHRHGDPSLHESLWKMDREAVPSGEEP